MAHTETEQKVVILLGPPGSGKGTQAVRLTEDLGIPHISTGDLFRDNIRRGTELGMRAKGYIDAGKLGPDELVTDMLFDRLAQPDAAKGYLLDGYPRTLSQAETFDKYLNDLVKPIVINLKVSDEEVIKRIGGRLTCSKCGHVHNRHFSPPQAQGICDRCGGELIQRPDDKAEVVQERLKVYYEQTAPLIDYYSKKGVLHHVNGEGSQEEILSNLRSLTK